MVHISEKTLSYLNGEFEVKDGDGASREEAIRLSGIRTYLIVRTLKQVRSHVANKQFLTMRQDDADVSRH